jgi:hypothetical protein
MTAVTGRAFSFTVIFTVLALTVTSLVGCKDEPKSGNGVNDVRASCEIRAKWNRTQDKCGLCEAAVVAPRCECVELAEFSAACIEQADARRPVCPDAVDTCVAGCQRTDCNCIDACYANDAACKNASAARDGCIAAACESNCK